SLRDLSDVVTSLKNSRGEGGSDKRQTTRLSVWSKINAHVLRDGHPPKTYSVMTRDISISGIGILQSFALPAGQEVILALPREKSPLFVCCKVMHSLALADGFTAVGMEFDKFPDATVSAKLLKDSSDEHA